MLFETAPGPYGQNDTYVTSPKSFHNSTKLVLIVCSLYMGHKQLFEVSLSHFKIYFALVCLIFSTLRFEAYHVKSL